MGNIVENKKILNNIKKNGSENSFFFYIQKVLLRYDTFKKKKNISKEKHRIKILNFQYKKL